MMSFLGASKRLEKVKRNDDVILYRDFTHAPSKVKASVDAFAEQFPGDEENRRFRTSHLLFSESNFLPQYKIL